jgi:hypothetical protein
LIGRRLCRDAAACPEQDEDGHAAYYAEQIAFSHSLTI